MNEIEFDSCGVTCRGIHTSGVGDDLARDGGRPCVVLAHGFSGTVDSGLLAFAQRVVLTRQERVAVGGDDRVVELAVGGGELERVAA